MGRLQTEGYFSEDALVNCQRDACGEYDREDKFKAQIWDAFYRKWAGDVPWDRTQSTTWLLDSSFNGVHLVPLPFYLETTMPSRKEFSAGTQHRSGGTLRTSWNACFARELYPKKDFSPEAMGTMWKFVKSALGSEFPKDAKWHQCRGVFYMNGRDLRENYFCSEIVALVLQTMGALNDSLPAANYMPQDFVESFASMRRQNTRTRYITGLLPCFRKHRLAWQRDYHLGPLIQIDQEEQEDEHPLVKVSGMSIAVQRCVEAHKCEYGTEAVNRRFEAYVKAHPLEQRKTEHARAALERVQPDSPVSDMNSAESQPQEERATIENPQVNREMLVWKNECVTAEYNNDDTALMTV